MKNEVVKFVGAFFLVIVVILIVSFWRGGKETTQTDVSMQLLRDSLKTAYLSEKIAIEDSIQKQLKIRDEVWQLALDAEKSKTKKAKLTLSEQNKTIKELEDVYAEQCGELINEYRERNDTMFAIIRYQATTIEVSEVRVKDLQESLNSKDREVKNLNSVVETKEKTITKYRDRNTTIENRLKRNFIFRNWYWMGGKYRKYVSQ
jgi:uncharacterized coiled-coil protein SlyX